jgi:flagella basal body P-ring formation protein FlgA
MFQTVRQFGHGLQLKYGRTHAVVRYLVALLALAFTAIQTGAAAEMRLKAQCMPAAAIVTLGDVADITCTNARQAATLAAIELFPAPAAGEEKVVRVREIQDLLLLHGVNPTEHQFSGSSEVAVEAAVARPRPAAIRPVSSAETARIKRRLSEAVVKYLNEKSASQQDWAVEFELKDSDARLFADPLATIEVAGGAAPWTGMQRFELVAAGQKGRAQATIDATVRVVAPVVVAVRAMARGEVVREGDVTLQRMPAADKLPGTMHALAEALGHELVRAVGTGMPVTSDALRPPLAVHRGEVVTVLARAGGVRVRTNAHAREDGSVGELVAVESLANRSTYYARVTGSREVEVYARPPQVENEP